jgi:hypothetical protein
LDVKCAKTYYIVKVVFVDLTIGNIKTEGAIENSNVNQNEISLHVDIKQLPILYARLVDTKAVEDVVKNLFL